MRASRCRTEIRVPVAGTIIESHVEQGQVISSPTTDVGGRTLLLKMADLTRAQVRTLVDETDVGKLAVGMPATVSVTAFPNQPLAGTIVKIEPQAVVELSREQIRAVMQKRRAGLELTAMERALVERLMQARGTLDSPSARARRFTASAVITSPRRNGDDPALPNAPPVARVVMSVPQVVTPRT